MPLSAETQYGRVIYEEAGHPGIEVQEGKPANVIERFKRKIKYYNQVLNVHLTVESNPQVQDIAISNVVIQVNPETAGAIRNEDFLLLHECAHDKQRALLGFPTTEELISSFSQDLTTSELGARDRVEKYTMPPFSVPSENQSVIFNYYSGEQRISLARGIRDVHSDVIALRNRKNIYMTDQEREEGKDPEEKFFFQFQDELTTNVPWYDYHKVQDTEPDFIRKIARFKAVAAGSAQFFKSDGLIVEKYNAYMKTTFGENSQQYQVYTALSRAYQTYFLNCTQRTELIDPQQMIAALNSPNHLMRARAADFLGETKDISAIRHLLMLLTQEENTFVIWNALVASKEIVEVNLKQDESWNAINVIINKGDCLTRAKIAEVLAHTPENRISEALLILDKLATVIYPIKRSYNWEDLEERYVKRGVCLALAEIGKKQPFAVVDLLRILAIEFWDESPLDVERSAYYERGPASALAEIGKARPDEVLNICEILINNGGHDDMRLVIGALSQLGKIRPTESFGLLRKIYINNKVERSYVLDATGFIGKAKPDEALEFIRSVQIEDQASFSTVLEAIGEKRPKAVIPFYLAMVDHSQSIVGANIVSRLVLLDGITSEKAARLLEKYRSRLLERYIFSPIDDRGAEPYKRIGSTGSDLALDILQRLSNSKYVEVRAVVVSGLIEFGVKRPDKALNVLIRMAREDESPVVVDNLAYSIGELAKFRPNKVLTILQKLQNHSDSQVRWTVANSLKYLATNYPAEVFDISKNILKAASDSHNRIHAAKALTQFASPAQLNQILSDPAIPSDSRDVLREYLTKTN